MKRPLRVRAAYLSPQAVARLSGVSLHRLRRYDSEGLIFSERIVTADDGQRLYEASVVGLVRRIRSYETIGVNLAGIEVILRLLQQRQRKSRQ